MWARGGGGALGVVRGHGEVSNHSSGFGSSCEESKRDPASRLRRRCLSPNSVPVILTRLRARGQWEGPGAGPRPPGLVRREAPGAPLLQSGSRIGAGSVESKSSGESAALTLRPARAGVLSAFSPVGQGVVPHLARTRIRQEPGHGAWSANLHSGESESPHLPAREAGPRGQTLRHGAVPPHPGAPLGRGTGERPVRGCGTGTTGHTSLGGVVPRLWRRGHWAGQRGESPASGGAEQPDPARGADTAEELVLGREGSGCRARPCL